MLFGKYASRRGEARYPTLWDGRIFSICPSIQSPAATAYDTSGRGLHATRLTGTATKWARSGGRASLDYDTTYYSRVGKDLGRDTTISWSAWMLIRSTGRRSFASSGPALGTPRLLIGVTAAQKIELFVGGYTTSTGSFSLNQWVHVGISCGGADNLTTYYFNGTQDSQVSQTYSNSTAIQADFYIGTGFNGIFDGLIDDVVIFNRIVKPSEFRLLATRRGIAYEARRQDYGSSGFQSAWARQRTQLIGGGI